jgi:hypothetical protein
MYLFPLLQVLDRYRIVSFKLSPWDFIRVLYRIDRLTACIFSYTGTCVKTTCESNKDTNLQLPEGGDLFTLIPLPNLYCGAGSLFSGHLLSPEVEKCQSS